LLWWEDSFGSARFTAEGFSKWDYFSGLSSRWGDVETGLVRVGLSMFMAVWVI
jgi:hypothetical protein